MGVIFYNGLKSTDYGIQVVTPPGYQAPALDIEFQHVPGRNGDIPIISDSYQNVSVQYEISYGEWLGDFSRQTRKVTEWLRSSDLVISDEEYDIYGYSTRNIKNTQNRYCKLYDSYDEDHYRLAIASNPLEVENILGQAGKATLEFNCKPEMYRTGEIWLEGTTKTGDTGPSVSFPNPTPYVARPTYYIEENTSSSATPTIVVTYVKYYKGSKTDANRVLENLSMTFKKGFDKMYIVTDTMDFVYQGENKAEYVNTFYTITGYPYLPPGPITVRGSAGIKTLKVKRNLYDI